MEFELTEEQISVQEAARDFTQRELLPGVIDRDREMKYPTEQVKMMGEIGISRYDGSTGVWWWRNGYTCHTYWQWKKSVKSTALVL
jgi:hypothetical protein